MITGPITENENNPNKIWGSWVYKGEFLNIEIKTPILTKEQLLLHLNNIAYGYKEMYQTQVGNFGQSASCEINVVCSLGTGWEQERNTVALGISGNGSDFFSGSMIMNACGTNRPFFLTANHVYNQARPIQDVSGWRFTFQAWSSTCPYPGTNSNGVTYNGSSLRANWSGTDFCLVELNNTPPSNSGIYYAGWSRNTTGITQTTIIHHPKGDVMKFTRDINPPIFNTIEGVQCWQLVVDNGATEGGSSGAPYFDQNHRIIGQHWGVNQLTLPVCEQVNKFAGRFDLSWTGGGTSTTRLSDWLDAGNSGAMTTNTTSVASLYAGSFLPVIGNSVVCGSSQTYSISGLSPGAAVSWSLGPPAAGEYNPPLQNVCSLTTNGNQATLTKVANGNVRLKATITSCGVTKYANKDVTFGVPSISNNGGLWTNSNGYKPITGTVNTTDATTAPILFVHTNNQYTWTKTGGSSNATYTVWPSSTNFNATVYFSKPVTSSSNINFSIGTSNVCGSRSDPLAIYYNGPNVYSVYPNPASSELTIETVITNNTVKTSSNSVNISSKQNIKGFDRIQIFDMRGIMVLDRRYPANSKIAKLNVSHLQSNVYIVRIFSNNI